MPNSRPSWTRPRRSGRRKLPSLASWYRSSAQMPYPWRLWPGHSSPSSSRARISQAPSRDGPRRASRSFSQGASGGRQKQPATLLQQLQASTAQLHRLTVLRNRLVLAHNRADTRDWAQERRARTRQLIELGGLVQKAGLVELLDDDRATLLGALLEMAKQLQVGGPEGRNTASLKAQWRRRGMRAFDAETPGDLTAR